MQEKMCISEEIGYNKPNPGFFDVCMESLEGIEKEDILIIGDALTSDIRGGNQSGIKTCWYNPHRESNPYEDVKPDYEIQNLNELKTILEAQGGAHTKDKQCVWKIGLRVQEAYE